jgi:acetylornithine/N-succinyldiaminopimelate aminotransferase
MDMKEVVPQPPPFVRNDMQTIRELYQKNVIPTYGRFELAFGHGSGSYLFDVAGRRYLDLGAGIAVCCLGHAHPALTQALTDQAQKLTHVSNLYYTESQGRLAAALVDKIGPGKVFFCNSGAEADEGLFKLARKFGHEEGRFEILTALNSFHGRTLAGISATGQDKVKKGFEPMTPGFRHVSFNDLAAMREALSPATAAILIEGIQGEGGITAARADYLLGLRRLCDEKKLLLLVDGVQCGHFRTGRFQSFQRILEGVPGGGAFLPDAVSMAKSMGGGFPMGAFWVREPYADLLGPGSHGTTYGGTPLACAVALKVLQVIEEEGLAENARQLGQRFKAGLEDLRAKFPQSIAASRGLGFMLGLELQPDALAGAVEGQASSSRLVNLLHQNGVLAIPAGPVVVRFLPPLNVRENEVEEGLRILESVLSRLS